MSLGTIRKQEEAKQRTKKQEAVRPITAIKKVSGIKKTEDPNAMSKTSYCRRCERMLSVAQFYVCTHPFIDKNGKLSVCASCLKDMYEDYCNFFQDAIKAIYSVCEDVDMRFDEALASLSYNSIKDNPSTSFSVMGRYRTEIGKKYKDSGQRFRDGSAKPTSFKNDEDMKDERKRELFLKWGCLEDDRAYTYLDNQYEVFRKSYNISDPSVQEAFKTLCILLWRQRVEPTNKDVTTLLATQMKLCGVSPEAIKKESNEQGKMMLGITILEMENTEPAEYIKNKNLYYDFDNLQRDFKDMKRAMKNVFVDSAGEYVYGENKIDFEKETEDIGENGGLSEDGQ